MYIEAFYHKLQSYMLILNIEAKSHEHNNVILEAKKIKNYKVLIFNIIFELECFKNKNS